MNTLELRNIVLQQVSQIEDKSLLSALKTILDSKVNSQIKLSKEQKKEIKLSQKEVAGGNYFEDETLDKEIRQWLEGK